MKKDIAIICRYREKQSSSKKISIKGLFELLGHLKNYYSKNKQFNHASTKKIRARIHNNIFSPEWIGLRRYGLFDLLNYILNDYRYVFNPSEKLGFFDPIGIPTITSIHIFYFLLKKGYKPVNFDNLAANKQNLIKFLNSDPLAVVISSTYFSSVEEITLIIKIIRKYNKEVAIIIGGSSILKNVDSNRKLSTKWRNIILENVYCIIDEYGFDTLDKLLSNIKYRNNLSIVPNISYLKNGFIEHTTVIPEIFNINDTYPRWEHPDVVRESNGVAFVRASQGCLFNCKFCTFPKATIKYKVRDVESIRRELITIHAAGIKNFAFTDDNFAITPKRIEEVCLMMIKEKFNFNWFAGIRASSITSENAALLREAGCKVICMGLESGDDNILKLMNKKTNSKSNMKSLEILDKNEILVYGSFLIGFPGENEKSIQKTIDWINNSPLKLYKVFMFYMLQESGVYDEQKNHEVSYFGDKYAYNLWKTPDFDAIKASEMIKYFILNIKRAALIYSYSPMYAFFPFFLKNYNLKESLKFFKIHTEIIKNEYQEDSFLRRSKYRKEKFAEMKTLLNKNFCNNK
ncbi:MAG: radical SAM protein [Syntrophotaleaceae bacterium]